MSAIEGKADVRRTVVKPTSASQVRWQWQGFAQMIRRLYTSRAHRDRVTLEAS
jgi:hypothetical protein